MKILILLDASPTATCVASDSPYGCGPALDGCGGGLHSPTTADGTGREGYRDAYIAAVHDMVDELTNARTTQSPGRGEE